MCVLWLFVLYVLCVLGFDCLFLFVFLHLYFCNQQQEDNHHQRAAQSASSMDVKIQETGIIQTFLVIVLGFYDLENFGWVVAHVDQRGVG